MTIHGAVGHYYEEHNMYGIGAFRALVAWEYAPDSWAYVSTYSDRMDPGPERLRSTLIQVAQAVSPGAEPVRLPLRTDARPSSVPPLSKLARVSPTMGTGWETAVDFGHLRFTVGPGTVPGPAKGATAASRPLLTEAGHPGCLNGYGTPAAKALNAANFDLDASWLEPGQPTARATMSAGVAGWLARRSGARLLRG